MRFFVMHKYGDVEYIVVNGNVFTDAETTGDVRCDKKECKQLKLYTSLI